MNVNDVIHGFRVLQMREFQELGGRLWQMEHEKTGARLCWLDRPDENKTFSVAFKTLPEDSTGVFHILEHSVLCGSDKYPVKEPFVELLKTSVQTFLNAITFSDKTVYPVSSRNDRDLLNLMDVYLDAVLHPAIYRLPEIFRQEGWRYEGEGEEVCYQGVVLNEMKGAFASASRMLEQEMESMLFPDNCYHYCSGGDPACIPDLTYERFIAFHQKYYHPSNARVSLVGSVNLDEVLEKIDSFFSGFDRRPADFPIPMQAPVPAQERRAPYRIGEEEPLEAHTLISCGTLLGRFDDLVLNDGASVLTDYLTGDDDAPLKRAVLDRKLAQDFSVTVHDGIQQAWISWDAWNTEASHLEELRATVREVLTREIENGLDRERLNACYRRYCFQMRDTDSSSFPRSLDEAIGMLDTWLYGGDPADGLLVDPSLEELGEKLETSWPEDLLRRLFLDNDSLCTLILEPSHTLGEEQAAAEQARLDREKRSWTEADLARLAEEAERLRVWQQTPDCEEALASIPMLRLEDLAEAPEVFEAREDRVDGVPVLRHELGTNLVYLRAHFRATDLTPEELTELAVACRLLGSLATADNSRARLPLQIKSKTGILDFSPYVCSGSAPDRCRVMLTAFAACLREQTGEAADLLGEVLTRTRWDDVDLLRTVLQQTSMGCQMGLPSAGHRYALGRVEASLTADGLAKEMISGVEFARRIKTLASADDETLRALLGRMETLVRRLVTRERLTLSACETVPDEMIERLLSAIPSDGAVPPAELVCAVTGPRQEGVSVPAAVGFAAMGANLRLQGRGYRGAYPVLSSILSYVYLWSEIRVQGGAYGCGFGARSDGGTFFYTYRDPQPVRSLAVIRHAADFVRGFCADGPDLTGFILGSVSQLDPLLGTLKRMTVAENRFFTGVSREDVCRWYRELLATKPADLLELLDALEDLFRGKAVCVVAGKTLLEACGEELREIVTV